MSVPGLRDGPTPQGRLPLLDAVRGLASLWVATAHIFTNSQLHSIFRDTLPRALCLFFEHGGHLGVMVFFALSGFVIAYSLLPFTVTGRFVVEFALRRSLRLDPPYWTAMLFLVSANAFSNVLLPDRVAPVPTVPTFVANMFYLQTLVRVPAVLDVAWTLCVEVQLYLIFVLGQAMLRKTAPRGAVRVTQAVFVVVTLALLAADVTVGRPPSTLTYAHAFFGGAAVCWALHRGLSFGVVTPLVVVVLASAVWLRSTDLAMEGLMLGLILVAGRQQWLRRTGGRLLQTLGALSYSLYLVHTTVSGAIENLGFRITGSSLAGAVVWAGLGLAGSLAVAWLLHRVVERPSLRLSSQLRGWHTRTAERPAVA